MAAQTFIFKKDGEDNEKIIDSIKNFIQKSFHRKLDIVLKYPSGKKVLPCYKMLHKDDLTYVILDAFDLDHQRRNTILQFSANTVGWQIVSDDAIWMGQGSEVVVEEDKITIKKTGGPVELTIT